MLSFAPRPDGTIPEDQVKLADEIGSWLKICGEAIYKTRPWDIFGEGPVSKGVNGASFTADDIRFTRNKANTVLYAIALDWPQHQLTLESLSSSRVNKTEIKSIYLVGAHKKLKWTQDKKSLTIQMPVNRPSYDYAYPVKILFKNYVPGVHNAN